MMRAHETSALIEPMTGKTQGGGRGDDVPIPSSWDLTPAEARIVRSLLCGLTTTEMARAYRLSVHTIRTQLKQAMRKAGVHSQAALVARVYSLARRE
jgi:DNA-binding CsgD family transcriptional regulator